MQKSEKNFKKGLLFIGSAVKISFCTVAFRRPWILPKEVFGLPNIKSAKKRVLIAEARNARNKAEKSALKTAIKKFEGAAADLSLSKNRLADDADIAYPLAFTEGSDTAAECGYAMVAPVEAGASLSLAVVTEQGGTCEVALPVPDAGFEKGKAYDVVLKFTTTAVEPVATIGAWVDASDRVEITL